jgi:hypothetical protein
MVSLSTANLTDLAIPIIPTAPTDDGDFQGQILLQITGDRSLLWIWNDNAWGKYSVSPIIGTVVPIGVIMPDVIGQKYVNTTAQTVYIAVGLNSSDWKINT